MIRSILYHPEIKENNPGRRTIKPREAQRQCHQGIVPFFNVGEIQEFNNYASMAEQLTMHGSIAFVGFY
jgi:hypothetical protein